MKVDNKRKPSELDIRAANVFQELAKGRPQSKFVILDDKLAIDNCNFQCLSGCPLPPGMDCIWDDPGIGMFDLIEYPEHWGWRLDNEKLVHPEPKDPMLTRCPRCFSTQINIGYPYIECRNCGYNEPLIDFTENVGF